MYRQSEKNLLNSSISYTCPHNMVNFGPLMAEIGWRVWGTPKNFNGFQVLASLLQRHHSAEANQTLHNVWLSPGLVYYIFMHFRGLLPLTEFCLVQNSLCVQVLRSLMLAALLHGTRPVAVSQTAAFSRGRRLYLEGQPSCWALAHILVNTNLPPILHHFRDIAFDMSKIAIFGYPSCI